MAWRSKSKLRANAIKHGYRSGFEHKVSDQLKENKIKFGYEMFCDKHGILWAEKTIPESWFSEK